MKDKYRYFISIILCMCSTILNYDGYMWFMIVAFWANRMWCVYTWWFDQTTSLSCYNMKWKYLKMYLIDEPLMRYDVNLFQFILNLMEIMCLVQEALKFSIGWLKTTTRTSSINKRNWNRQEMFLVNDFRRRPIMGHWSPIVSINEHDMIGMMVLR